MWKGNDPICSPPSNEYLLVGELTHRLNNEFASMIGFAFLLFARSTSDEVKDALTNIKGLLRKLCCCASGT